MEKQPNHTHAWRGAWNRPMHLDENSLHPFTVARMTDHNVRGVEQKDLAPKPEVTKDPIEVWEEDGGQ